MWPFTQRRKEFKKTLKDLETRLKDKGVKIDNFFSEPKILDFLTHGSFLEHFLENFQPHSWYGGYYELSGDQEDFLRLIKTFRKRRKNPDYKLEIITINEPPYFSLRDYVSVGRIPNPNFEREKKKYDLQIAKNERIEAQIEYRRGNLLNSEEGQVYQYVKSENGKKSCYLCRGTGYHETGQSGIGHILCELCSGGEIDYKPKVSEEQWQIFWKIGKQLSHLENEKPSKPYSPCNMLSVYVKIR